ncbi:hypothetical protein SDC9_97214 [bioreactor metagenome]|uniref:Uncharacterized protein n=1 Tax=bioreactor metagenome TaxID=1076179 RepID=A0A645AHY8_9ZZZZ
MVGVGNAACYVTAHCHRGRNVGKTGIDEAEHVGGHGNRSGLDKHGNRDRRYDDIRGNPGNSHAEDDAHEHDHQAAEVQLSFTDNLEDDVSKT